MANTFTRIYIHILFAVKGRQNLIHQYWEDELHKYICGIVKGNSQKVYAIGGMPDHIHILVGIKPNITISDLVRDIKSCSSKWINKDKKFVTHFQWQEGYGAFTYSQSQIDKVVKYINKQHKHHHKRTFKEEYLELLQNFEIDYDPKYLFEWIE